MLNVTTNATKHLPATKTITRLQRILAGALNLQVSRAAKNKAKKFHEKYNCFGYHGYATGKCTVLAVPFDGCAYCERRNDCYKRSIKNAQTAFPELVRLWESCVESARKQGGGITLAKELFKGAIGLSMKLEEYFVAVNIAEGSKDIEPGTSFRDALKDRAGWSTDV